MGTISVPRGTCCLTLEVANGNIWIFDRKRQEPKEYPSMFIDCQYFVRHGAGLVIL